MSQTLVDLTGTDEDPGTPADWQDISEMTEGFDVLANPVTQEVALIVHPRTEGVAAVGFVFDTAGALALAEALSGAVDTAREVAAAAPGD